jgi:hypothetical protein
MCCTPATASRANDDKGTERVLMAIIGALLKIALVTAGEALPNHNRIPDDISGIIMCGGAVIL